MRILHVTPRFSESAGGDGLYAFHLARGQVIHGDGVAVVTIGDGGFVYRELGVDGDRSAPVVLGEAPHSTVGEHYYWRSAGASLHEAISRSNPDVIHIHGIHQYFTSAAIPVLRAAGRPIIYTIHDYKLLCGNAGFFSDRKEEQCTLCLTGHLLHPTIERCKKSSLAMSAATSLQMEIWSLCGFLELIDVIHAPSAYVADLLSRNDALRDRIITVRHPLLTSVRSYGRDEGPLQVLFFGRLVPHKGAHIAIGATRGLGIPVHVVGDGPDMERCRAVAAGDPNIHFHGWRTQSEIRQFMGPNTIAVIPSLSPETFCFAVVEALIEGCCVVASGRGAIPELVRHDQNGWVVPDPTVSGFRDAVIQLMDDEGRRRCFSAAARRIGEELVTVDELVVQIESVYHHAVKRHAAKAR